MNRIPIPTVEKIPEASIPLLAEINKQLGTVPNMMKLIGNSPSALEGYLSLSNSLKKGAITKKTRERIALALAEINGSKYCLSAHSYFGKNMANLNEEEIKANRSGTSLEDPKAAAAIHFAAKVALDRGHVCDSDIEAVRKAGHTDAEIVEIVLHVALNTLTNYLNSIAKLKIDFPAESLRATREKLLS